MGLQIIQEVDGPPQILCDACARVYEASADLLEHGVCPSDDCPSNSKYLGDTHNHMASFSECEMARPGDEPYRGVITSDGRRVIVKIAKEESEEEIDLSALGWRKPK